VKNILLYINGCNSKQKRIKNKKKHKIKEMMSKNKKTKHKA
jgi:hypothetical protein